MKYLYIFIIAITLSGCTGEVTLPLKGINNKVEIYQLKSFSHRTDTSFVPFTVVLSDMVLEDIPLVNDYEIKSYTQSSYTFELSKDLNPVIKNYGPDKAFVVTVNREVVYYGMFRPGYLNSIIPGLPYIDPIFANTNLKIGLPIALGTVGPQPADKRNDTKLIDALKASSRLK